MANEEISTAALDDVTKALEGDKPPTKKWACEKLGIKYNTKRLQKLIQDRKDQIVRERRIKRKLRGTAATFEESRLILSGYIEGESLSELAKTTFRSVGFIKKVLADNNVPQRAKKTNYFCPELLPDNILERDLASGSIVFSARYNEVAEVEALASDDPIHGPVYGIWLLKTRMKAYQPWYELGDMTETFKKFNLSYMVQQ